MYHILIYPQSGFQNYQELFQEIFEKHGIENPFCDIYNCCNTTPCNKGKFYQSFVSFESFSLTPKFKRNQKYLVLYQKNILQVLENAYMQDQTIEKTGSTFLSWIQKNKSQYSQFSSQYLQSTSKSVMYMDYQTFEKTPLQSILSIMKFLEPNFPFNQDIVFTCFKVFDQLNGKPNYSNLYKDYLSIQISENELNETNEQEIQEAESEIQNVENELNETEIQNPESEIQEAESEIQNAENELNETETQEAEPEIQISENELNEIEIKKIKPMSNPVDGFNAEMESLYLELILEKKIQHLSPKMQPQPKKPNTKKIHSNKKPAKQNAQTKAKINSLFQKQQMIQKQLQKAKAQNKQFQQKIGDLSKFIK